MLHDNKNKPLTSEQIAKISDVNLRNVEQALVKFMNNDYVYQPTINGEFFISPEGESAYNE